MRFTGLIAERNLGCISRGDAAEIRGFTTSHDRNCTGGIDV
jgi:hypothetical protein